MYYHVFEQHLDGTWWYHMDSFTDKAEADAFARDWLWWDPDRPTRVFEMHQDLPLMTLWTIDFVTFRSIGGEDIYVYHEFEDMNKEITRKFLPGEKVRYKGQDAEVLDVYPNTIVVRIGRNTYKSVKHGELEVCGPDGDKPRGEEVCFG